VSADTVTLTYTNPQDLNLYGYVLNNPLRYTDPTGHRVCEDDGAGGCLSEKQVTKRYETNLHKHKKKDNDHSSEGKPLLAPSPSNSNDTIKWCGWMDCILSGIGFVASLVTLGPPPYDGAAFVVDGVVTVWSIGRTNDDFSKGKISETRQLWLNGTAAVGLAPGFFGPALGGVGAAASTLNLFMTVTGIPN
jgi:hypothetical protein